eukprot:2294947-Pleurochrysis_carterae.AAC.2
MRAAARSGVQSGEWVRLRRLCAAKVAEEQQFRLHTCLLTRHPGSEEVLVVTRTRLEDLDLPS